VANLIIDLANSTINGMSVLNTSGSTLPSSGVNVGRAVDLLQANTLCNVATTYGNAASGFIGIQVQESDTNVSGNFVPVLVFSGTWSWLSGGRFVLQSSGIGQSGTGPVSGGTLFNAFERRFRYVRAITESGGLWDAPVNVGFISQSKIDGSGGGFSFSPGSGVVSV